MENIIVTQVGDTFTVSPASTKVTVGINNWT